MVFTLLLETSQPFVEIIDHFIVRFGFQDLGFDLLYFPGELVVGEILIDEGLDLLLIEILRFRLIGSDESNKFVL